MKQVSVAGKALTLLFSAAFLVACSSTDTKEEEAAAAAAAASRCGDLIGSSDQGLLRRGQRGRCRCVDRAPAPGPGKPGAQRHQTCHAPDLCNSDDARGLEVSLCGLGQYQLVQCQV